MKLYIVADMEGATGVVHKDDLGEDGGEHYRRACKWLTGDVNAAIEGAKEAGVTEVVVSEGHAHMRNVLLEELDPTARLVRGPATWENKPLCQVSGLDDSFDLAFLVGFHSRAGTPSGLLSHTWAGAIVHEIVLDGRVVGETAINAAICGRYGVPVGLVAGASDVAAEARESLGHDVETAAVKRSIGWNIAECAPPSATRPLIAAAARRAVERHRSDARAAYAVPSPVTAELETHRREMADKMKGVPGLERIGERRLRAVGPDAPDVLSTLWRGVVAAFHEPAAWLR